MLTGSMCMAAAIGITLVGWQRSIAWLLVVGAVVASIGMAIAVQQTSMLLSALSIGAGIITWSITSGMSAGARWYGLGIGVIYILQGVGIHDNGSSFRLFEMIGVLYVLTVLIILIESADAVVDRRIGWGAPIIVLHAVWGHATVSVLTLGIIIYLSMRVIAVLPSILHRSSGSIVPLGAWTLGALVVMPSVDLLLAVLGNVAPSFLASLHSALAPALHVIREHAASTVAVTGLLAAAERWLGWDLKLRTVVMLLAVLSASVVVDAVLAYVPAWPMAQTASHLMAWSRVAIYALILVPAAKATMFSTAP